jgi:hypothetical protein
MEVKVWYHKAADGKVDGLLFVWDEKKFKEMWELSYNKWDEFKTITMDISDSIVRQIRANMVKKRGSQWANHHFLMGIESGYRLEFEANEGFKYLWLDPLPFRLKIFILKKWDTLLTLLEG